MTQPVDKYTCEEAFRRLDDYLDRELTSAEMKLVKEHLDTCQVCAREFTFEASVLDQLRAKLRRIDVPEDLRAKVSKRIEQARRDATRKSRG